VLACRERLSYYSLPLVWDLRGALDVPALTRALADLTARHEALRTCFAIRGDEVDQLVWPSVDLDLSTVDISAESSVVDQIVAETERPRRVDVAPLWHGVLYRLAERRHLLALFVHHLVFDGWSHGVLHDELIRCYRGAVAGRPARLPELRAQAGDHAEWERAQRDEAAEVWWRDQLRGLPPLSVIPPVGGRFVSVPLPVVPADQVAVLRRLASEQDAGLSSVLLAVVLAARRSRTGDDAIVGVTRAGRDRSGLQRVVGPLLDHVPVRVDLSGARTFPEVVARTHRAYQAALARALPLGRIRQVTPDDLSGRGGRLYDTRFNYLPGAAATSAVISTSDGHELSIAPYPLDPLRLAPRHTEDHPEVLPYSFILRRLPGGEIGGEVCGHDSLGDDLVRAAAAVGDAVEAAVASVAVSPPRATTPRGAVTPSRVTGRPDTAALASATASPLPAPGSPS
jgi:arthrofactin-type cyclic lipopeptide synthetase C